MHELKLGKVALGFAIMPPVFALKTSSQQDNFFSLKLQRSG
jgi:hypothetical protein